MAKKAPKWPLIVVLLDRTGSMSAIREPTIRGYNDFLTQQKAEQGAADWTLVIFDSTSIDTIEDAVPVAQAALLTEATYVPRDWTPLYDAIGNTIRAIEEKGRNEVLFAIVTDGQENASKEWNRKQIFELIKMKEKLGWQFVYLGQHADTWDEAQAIGISGASTSQFAGTATGTQSLYAHVSTLTSSYRSTGTAVPNDTASDTPTWRNTDSFVVKNQNGTKVARKLTSRNLKRTKIKTT